MSKEIEKRIQEQIDYSQQLISILESDGHEIDFDIISLLDDLASLGLELTPIKDRNIPSLAFFHLMTGQPIEELAKETLNG